MRTSRPTVAALNDGIEGICQDKLALTKFDHNIIADVSSIVALTNCTEYYAQCSISVCLWGESDVPPDLVPVGSRD
jgi:hypothetical protein